MVNTEESFAEVRRLVRHPHTPFALLLLVCTYYSAVRFSVVLDDAFIYFRVVRNLLDAGIPAFNPGEKYFIVTSPLWLAILTAGKSVFNSVELEALAKMVWLLLLVFASYFAYRMLSPVCRRWATVVPCFFLLSPAIGSVMGNEIALLYAAMFGLTWSVFNGKPFAAGVFLGIGYLARGEFILFVIPVAAHWVLFRRNQAHWKMEGIRFHWRMIFAAAPLILLWHACYWWQFQQIFPETFRVKVLQGSSGYWPLYHERLWGGIQWILNGHVYLLLFAIVGALRRWEIWGIPVLFMAVHTLVYTAYDLPFYHWYYYDYFIVIPLLIFFGAIEMCRMLASYLTHKGHEPGAMVQVFRIVSPPAVRLH